LFGNHNIEDRTIIAEDLVCEQLRHRSQKAEMRRSLHRMELHCRVGIRTLHRIERTHVSLARSLKHECRALDRLEPVPGCSQVEFLLIERVEWQLIGAVSTHVLRWSK